MKAKVVSDFGSMLNIRSKPNVSSKIVDRIEVGTIVEVKKYGLTWSTIIHNGKTGNIMNSFLVFGDEENKR